MSGRKWGGKEYPKKTGIHGKTTSQVPDFKPEWLSRWRYCRALTGSLKHHVCI